MPGPYFGAAPQFKGVGGLVPSTPQRPPREGGRSLVGRPMRREEIEAEIKAEAWPGIGARAGRTPDPWAGQMRPVTHAWLDAYGGPSYARRNVNPMMGPGDALWMLGGGNYAW